MNYELKLHNIRIAWRNLLKYKVQNTIAVLCLAVGMVCFSMTSIITHRAWQSWKREGGDPRRAKVELYTQNDSILSVCPNDIQRIADSHLPSIDFIDINNGGIGVPLDFTDFEGKKHSVYTWSHWISPKHLNYLGLRSAITGKRIPVLKPGDVIMTKGMLERTFGKDVNPVGFEVKRLTYQGNSTITDVVDTGDWMLNEDCMMIVTDMFKEWADKHERTFMRHFDVILAEGKTDKDLQRELQEVLPEYKVKAETRFSIIDKKSLFFTLLIGSSILLIGLFGFLKTQIQLFRLRQREMGLRQCMGAQRGQLFGLMMWEVVIVFSFVTLLTLLLTALLADYAFPIMQTEIDDISIDMPRTYATELWICLATFLVTASIAALSVRKVVTTPLNEVVGKSHRTSTRGRGLLIILQMIVCQLLLFFVLGTVVFGHISMTRPANADAFRNCILTENCEWNPEWLDTIPHLQHIAGSTHVVETWFQQDLNEGDEPFDPRGLWQKEDGSRYCTYSVLLTDEHLFGLLDMKIYPTDTDEMHHTAGVIPVYVPKERANELRQKFGLQAKGEPEYHTIEKGKQAEKIGYAICTPLAPLTGNSYLSIIPYFYICETSYFLDKNSLDFRVWKDFEGAYEGWSLNHNIILKAKPKEYKSAKKELTSLYHKEGKYTLVKAPIDNLYNVCYKDLRMNELAAQILWVMAAVALLCIVLTLYSSVSLDTRGRQKEVAIRKAHGAGAKQIMWLFGKQYVWQLIISSIWTLIICIFTRYALFWKEMNKLDKIDNIWEMHVPYVFAVLVVALITLLTVGYKIYKVSRLEPASIIKKE